MNAHPEDDLQMAVADFCHLTLLPEVTWYAVPNGGYRNKREAARLQRMGVLPGVPDLFFMWSATIVGLVFPIIGYIELKSENGRLSSSQRMFAKKADLVGAKWAECRSLEEVIVTLKSWEIPMRNAEVAA